MTGQAGGGEKTTTSSSSSSLPSSSLPSSSPPSSFGGAAIIGKKTRTKKSTLRVVTEILTVLLICEMYFYHNLALRGDFAAENNPSSIPSDDDYDNDIDNDDAAAHRRRRRRGGGVRWDTGQRPNNDEKKKRSSPELDAHMREVRRQFYGKVDYKERLKKKNNNNAVFKPKWEKVQEERRAIRKIEKREEKLEYLALMEKHSNATDDLTKERLKTARKLAHMQLFTGYDLEELPPWSRIEENFGIPFADDDHDHDHDDSNDQKLESRRSTSLTISEDDESSDDDGFGNVADASFRSVPARRSHSVAGAFSPSHASVVHPLARDDPNGSSSSEIGGATASPVAKKFLRHFSQGSYPPRLAMKTKKKIGASGKADPASRSKDSSDGDSSASNATPMDEFDRPLIRLEHGDRVQVVSMDARGWVKLARGYGYIRLENDKQLVKVGGTSDKACQIEAMLHELSLERNRLKQEQTKLERLSAGLMIDLQSSLITSDDHVVVPAPEGLLPRNDSELSLSLRPNPNVSLDDIDVSNRSKSTLTPPRSANEDGQRAIQPTDHKHRQIRTAKSHSPGRTSQTPDASQTKAKAPPSPPYGQVIGNIPESQQGWSSMNTPTTNTPTRVNFRTGLSGHRALTSSLSHPHDFIETRGIRSMSNHAGISSSKKASNSRGRSIY